jgi:hypothetical protein
VTPGEGYGVRAVSKGLNISLFEAPLRGKYTPIRGDAVQGVGGVNSRMIHPAAMGDEVLLSHLERGPPDELGRPTFQNHIAISPRELLVDGRVSLGTVDQGIADYELKNPGALGELGPLEVQSPPKGHRLGMGLRQHVTRAAVETIATRRLAEPNGRTLLLCREAEPIMRNEVLFRLIELLNFTCGLPSFTSMSDAPTASSLNVFDLVVAPRGVRADTSWAIVDSTIDKPGLRRIEENESMYAAIEDCYAADAPVF